MARSKFSDRALAGGVPPVVSGAERVAHHFRWSGYDAAAVGVRRVRCEKAVTDESIAAVAHIMRVPLTKIDDGDAWMLVLGEAP